jgi:hypothetical protein
MAMQKSSDSIGSLAAALARAQVELINPEKSMVATIRPEGRGATEQMFRYAPLSNGLNIIRKTLGQHEIATAIDLGRPNRRAYQAQHGISPFIR